MTTDKYRDLIWKRLILADYRHCFFFELAIRYHSRRRKLAWGVALLSSGTVLTLLGKASIATQVPWLDEILALITAALAWWVFITPFDELARKASKAAGEWTKVLTEYELLWADLEVNDVPAADVPDKVRAIENRHPDLDEISAIGSKNDDRIRRRSWDAMLIERGLKENMT